MSSGRNAKQELDRAGDILDLGEAADRRQPLDFGDELGPLDQAFDEGRAHEGRRDGVDADALPRPLDRQRARACAAPRPARKGMSP